jgi:ribosomal protein RSM22 (predicted rRNA methylase)
VILDVCSPEGTLQRRIATRSRQAGPVYRLARMLRWGDLWPYELDALIKDGRGRGPDDSD